MGCIMGFCGAVQLQVGVELEVSSRLRDSSVALGYQLELPRANLLFRGERRPTAPPHCAAPYVRPHTAAPLPRPIHPTPHRRPTAPPHTSDPTQLPHCAAP